MPSRSIATDQAANLAPAEDRAQFQVPKRPLSNLKSALTLQLQKIKNQDMLGTRYRHRQWLENFQFYRGNQYGFWDDEAGTYQAVESTPKRRFYTVNFFSGYVDTTQKEWARAKAQLNVHPASDKAEAMGAARCASNILAYYQRKLRGPDARQREGLNAALVGTYFRYTYFDPMAGSQTTSVPITEPQDIQLSGPGYQCNDCGSNGAEEDLLPHPTMGSQCPDCGSTSATPVPPVSITTQSVTGYQERPLGDIVTEDPDAFEIRVHSMARCGDIATSPWLCRHRRVYKPLLEQSYPGLNFEALGHSDDINNYGIRFQRKLERQANGMAPDFWDDQYAGHGSEDNDTAILYQTWLDKVCYADWVLEQPVQTVVGQTIPAGIPLGQVFPNGMYFAMAAGCLLDVRDENKNDHWVAGVYRIFPGSFWGRGVEDAIPQQKLMNDAYNLYIDYLKYCSAPTILYNSLIVDGGQLSGLPGEIIPVENAGPDVNLGNLYVQIPAAQMPQQVPAFIETCKKDLQQILGAFTSASGLPDVDVTTATGMKLLREASVALVAMALSINALVEQRWAEQVLALAQKYFVYPRSIPVKSDHGQLEIQWFSAADIDQDLVVSYAENSIMPRSEIERRNDLVEAMSIGNLALGLWNPQIPPELRRVLADVFNVPYQSDTSAQIDRQFKMRLDQITQLVESVQQMAQQIGPQFLAPPMDPMTGQPQINPVTGDPMPSMAIQQILQEVPIIPKMDDHQTHMRLIQEWFLSDEGLFADPILGQVMVARFDEHFLADIQNRVLQSQAEVMAQGPQMQAAAMAGNTMGGAGLPATKAPQPTPTDKIAPPAKPNI